jgi:hypothetical protein
LLFVWFWLPDFDLERDEDVLPDFLRPSVAFCDDDLPWFFFLKTKEIDEKILWIRELTGDDDCCVFGFFPLGAIL